MTISRLKDIRTDEGVDARSGAGAVVGEARKLAAVDQLEAVLDGPLARSGVGAEPGNISDRAPRDIPNVPEGVFGIDLGVGSGIVELRFPGRRTTDECGPLGVDAGDSEVSRELDLSGIFNSGEEVLGGAIRIDIGEEVRWLDGVVSSPSSSEVVGSRD